MADVLCDENEDSLINNVVKQFDLLNYEVKYEEGSKKGDNYVGILEKLIITGVETNGKIFNETFLLKRAPSDEKRRIVFNCESCFNREITMYDTVLPKLTEFLKENNINEQFKFAKLYAASKKLGYESLILEDLTAGGYEMKDKRKSLDIFHCRAVMKNFALLHSISFVLKRRKPELFNEISNLPETFFNDKFLDYYSDVRMGNTLKRILACLDEKKEQYLIDKVTEVSKHIHKDFHFCLSKEEANNYVVICHGDSWINNLFFKYKDPVIKTIPNSVCFIDWQLSRCSSPVIDLVYFLYSSTDKDLRELYIKELYDYYYTNLTINLQLFGESIEELYPRYEYDLHIKKFSRLGLWVAMLLLQILLSKEDDSFDSDEIINTKDKYEEAMLKKAYNDENYRSRVHDIVVELFEGQYI